MKNSTSLSIDRFPDEKALKAALRISRRIGDHKVIDDSDILDSVSGDESHISPRRPAALIRARTEEDIQVTLEVAQQLGVPVTPRGAGTGKSGGAIPLFGGLVLSIGKLDEIRRIDGDNLVASVGPGVITGQFHEIVEEQGLFFPPDPASLDTCCLGGNVAENAGGPRAFKYGVTNRYVLGLGLVIPGGKKLTFGKQTVKGVAGYDVTSLLVGSEGTLGVFTDITLRLLPKPQSVRTALALFPSAHDAGKAVSMMVSLGLVPRVIEFMDRQSLSVLRSARKLPIPENAESLLLIEVDGNLESLDSQIEKVADACEGKRAIDILIPQSGSETRKLWAARRELSELIGHGWARKLSDDVVVPRSEIATMIERTYQIGEKSDVTVACYGHAGDGNLHVNILYNDEDPTRAEKALELIVREAVSLGGTITGEHGVGCAKRHLLNLEQTSDAIEIQKSLKKVFDPHNVMNPGKIF